MAAGQDGAGHPRVETEGVPGDGVPPGRTQRRALRQLERRVETTAGVPSRSPRHHDTERDMDRQDAQQHSLQGAEWTSLRASHGTPGTGGYVRDLEGHPPETRSASDPRTRQGEPPGR